MHVMTKLETILDDAKTIAVVGISSNPERISHIVARYLQDAGFRVIPVNPGHKRLLDTTCYPDLLTIPEEITIDIVDVFRRPEHTADVVEQVVERARRTGQRPLVWTQIGVSSDEAMAVAKAADLPYVANACTMATHKRMA
jgi:predicted CoA-binding protein